MNTDIHEAVMNIADSPVIQAGGSISVAMRREAGVALEALIQTALKGTSESQLAETEMVLTLRLQPIGTAPKVGA